MPDQGEIFAAEGYAKSTGDVGVCIATSGPGATNLVTGLADALLDSVPLVAITGQARSSENGLGPVQRLPLCGLCLADQWGCVRDMEHVHARGGWDRRAVHESCVRHLG